METVKVVYMDGKETEYHVEYPVAYVAKIMESQNELSIDRKSVREIYTSGELTAVFTDGFSNELVLNKFRSKKTTNAFHDAYVDRHKPIVAEGELLAGCDVGQYAVSVDELAINLKDQIKAEEDWNAYQAEIAYPQKMLKENVWVTDHTGGNVEITYIPKSL